MFSYKKLMEKGSIIMKERAVAYIRVSTEDQKRISPEVQQEEVKEYAERENLEIVKLFEEHRSGWKREDRIEFYKMLDFIKKNKTEHLLSILPDRLYRNMEDYVELRKTDVDIKLHMVLNNRSFSLKDREAYDEIYHHEIDVAEGKRYSARLSHRVRKSFNRKWRNGEYTSRAPLGYWHNPMTDKIELDTRENRAELVKQAFELMSTGNFSVLGMTEKMKNLGLTTREGNPVPRSSLAKIFRNPFYYGSFVVKGETYKGKHEALLLKELWERVQEVLDGKRTTKNNPKGFLFKGLIKCGYCKCDLIGEIKKEKYVYYHCSNGKMQSDPDYYKNKFGTKKCPLHDAGYLRKQYGNQTYEDKDGNRKPVFDGKWFKEAEIKRYFEAAINRLEIDEQRKDELVRILTEQNEERKATDEIEIKNLRREEQQNEEKMSKMLEEKLKGNFPEDFILKEFNKLITRNDEIDARLENLKEHNEEKIEKGLRSLELLRKDFKKQYLKAFFAADSETRRELSNFMFRTVWAGECKFPIAGSQPLYFEWNELFEKFFEIGVLKGFAEWKEKNIKKRMSRAWRDSNSRPAA
jgi:DNA invertase Pin-like site-specific DNA recombinase